MKYFDELKRSMDYLARDPRDLLRIRRQRANGYIDLSKRYSHTGTKL